MQNEPIILIKTIDKSAKNSNIVAQKTNAKLDYILSNSFGFGGTNSSLIIKKFTK